MAKLTSVQLSKSQKRFLIIQALNKPAISSADFTKSPETSKQALLELKMGQSPAS